MRIRKSIKVFLVIPAFIGMLCLEMVSDEFWGLSSTVVWAQKEESKTKEASPEQEVKPVQVPKLPERPKTINVETLRMMEKIEGKTKELKKRSGRNWSRPSLYFPCF